VCRRLRTRFARAARSPGAIQGRDGAARPTRRIQFLEARVAAQPLRAGRSPAAPPPAAPAGQDVRLETPQQRESSRWRQRRSPRLGAARSRGSPRGRPMRNNRNVTLSFRYHSEKEVSPFPERHVSGARMASPLGSVPAHHPIDRAPRVHDDTRQVVPSPLPRLRRRIFRMRPRCPPASGLWTRERHRSTR